MTRGQFKYWGIQGLRHLTQLLVIGLIFALVYLSLYAHYRAARVINDNSQFLTGWTGTVLKQIHPKIESLKEPQAFLDNYKGTLWSMRVGGVNWTDPLAAFEMVATSHTFYWPIIWSIAIPVGLTLLLGRVFCSWICPASMLFAVTDKIRKLLKLAEIKPAEVRFSHNNKYVFLVVGLGIAFFVGLPFFTLIYPPAVISRIAHALIYGTAYKGMIVILLVMVLIEIFVSPRWWCRTMCPGGALYSLLGVKRLLRVRLDKKKCTGCKDCIPVCPMGINPITESASIECDNCGVCLPHCGDDALYYQVGLPPKKKHKKKRKTKPASSAAAAMVLLAIIFCPSPVFAHHILGIPHYAYKENYPQAPTLEYPAFTGPYDILLTTYPGRPAVGEPLNIAFYIKNRKTLKPYENNVYVSVDRSLSFGRHRPILKKIKVAPFDGTHKVTTTFPVDGEYIIKLTIDVEGQVEVIPFLLVAGKPTSDITLLSYVVGGFLLFFVLIRAIRIKQKRRLANASTSETA